MSRVLIVDDAVKAKVQQVIDLAKAKPYSLEAIRAMAEGFDPKNPATRTDAKINMEFTIKIPVGYTVTYTHEQQPMGLCRHLSVSVEDGNKLPNPVAVQEIMILFGFVNPITKCPVWEERYAQGFSAINVIEAIKPIGRRH